MQDSIFTKIIKGEIPSHQVYEDDKTLAIMDIHPIQEGHVLVISKKQVDHIWDLPDEDYQAVMSTVKKTANKLREVFPDKKRIGVIIEGFDVAHVHVKVFPVDSGNEIRQKQDLSKEPDHKALADMAERLAFK